MSALSPNVLRALRFLGIGRRRIRELFGWAADNPGSACVAAVAAAGFCRHRARVLRKRRWGINLKKRIARMFSAAQELERLAAELRKLAVARGSP